MTDDDIRSLLKVNHDNLIDQYHANAGNISALQKTLLDQVLPHLRDELHLRGEDVRWAYEWLQDTATIFRILRRHKFTRSFALEAIRNILIWRLNVLRPAFRLSQPALLRCLPPPAADPFGRPLVILKVSILDALGQDAKEALLPAIERLRLHLRSINAHRDSIELFALQFVFLVDLEGVTLQSFNAELISWLMKEVIPCYPGMLAAVFLLNYSWAHSGMWSIAKRVLPASAISRVFFPSQDDLLQLCAPSALPREYGGLLPVLDDLDDPLPHLTIPQERPRKLQEPDPDGSDVQVSTSIPRTSSSISIPPTSFLNPFYGYPVVTSSSNPHNFRYNRRRKRDLLRTLAILWWRRWGMRSIAALCVLAVLVTNRTQLKRWLPLSAAAAGGVTSWQQLRVGRLA
ncbi:CRAL/TRIO domain-containing protein [Leucogyrophana mollusca]|uniref:CRAL/TRIO domain-containing protein n=1 Tax=Leucogyrophana mollusca TaxID=85980 RepID=A0ACB8BHB6_9AGAM|nr:CRAL/TRIO domain-containing protein [Leucogyrophana mollusca]